MKNTLNQRNDLLPRDMNQLSSRKPLNPITTAAISTSFGLADVNKGNMRLAKRHPCKLRRSSSCMRQVSRIDSPAPRPVRGVCMRAFPLEVHALQSPSSSLLFEFPAPRHPPFCTRGRCTCVHKQTCCYRSTPPLSLSRIGADFYRRGDSRGKFIKSPPLPSVPHTASARFHGD